MRRYLYDATYTTLLMRCYLRNATYATLLSWRYLCDATYVTLLTRRYFLDATYATLLTPLTLRCSIAYFWLMQTYGCVITLWSEIRAKWVFIFWSCPNCRVFFKDGPRTKSCLNDTQTFNKLPAELKVCMLHASLQLIVDGKNTFSGKDFWLTWNYVLL
jgi:hypothetical protein